MATGTDRPASGSTTRGPAPRGVRSLGFGSLAGTLMWLTGTGDEVRELALRAVAALAKATLTWLAGG